MAKTNERVLGQLEAKLQELHEDIKGLRADVEELKKDFIQRGTMYKVVSWAVGIVITTGIALFSGSLSGHR